ncbi:hypothetical protein NW757_011378 [Fusarium falciforme]|nr:hypothetical protein NW757_011378 [Fusarium falciforme]
MSVSHLEWFANFPVPLAEVLRCKNINVTRFKCSINNYDSSNNSQLMQCSLLQSLTLPRSLNDVDNVQCLNRL